MNTKLKDLLTVSTIFYLIFDVTQHRLLRIVAHSQYHEVVQQFDSVKKLRDDLYDDMRSMRGLGSVNRDNLSGEGLRLYHEGVEKFKSIQTEHSRLSRECDSLSAIVDSYG